MITETIMEPGVWDLKLRDDTPQQYLDRLSDGFSLLAVYAQHVKAGDVLPGSGPLYRGVLLRRTGIASAQGAGPAWYLGTPNVNLLDTGWDGPYFASTFTGANLAAAIGYVATKNGITTGTVGANANTLTVDFNTNARTILDQAIRPAFHVEWRLNPDLTLDAGTVAQLYGGTAQAVISAMTAGRDPGPVTGFQLAADNPSLDWGDYRNRVIVNYQEQVDEIQTVTIIGGPTGGNFKLKHAGNTTANIPYNATPGQVQTALVALPSVLTGDINVTGFTGGPYAVTFQAHLGGANIARLVATDTFTGGASPHVQVDTLTTGGSYPAFTDSGVPSDSFAHPGGGQLEYGHADQTSGKLGNANDLISKITDDTHHVTRALTVDLDDYLVRDHVPTPTALVGGYVNLWHPELGFYDLNNPVDFRGAAIFPVQTRVVSCTWPLQRGVGVYLDNRHQGGSLLDVTNYVEWETGATTLDLGGGPKGFTGKRRPYAP